MYVRDQEAQHHNACPSPVALFRLPNLILCLRPLEASQRSIHPDRSEMEQSILATRYTMSGITILQSNSRFSQSSSRHEDGLAPTSKSGPAVGGMADFVWQDILTEWYAQKQALLILSWRSSTINTYRPAWNRSRKRRESHYINYKYPNADQGAVT